MKIHKLKLNAKYYEDSERGIKTFEIRKSDRDYEIGDVLELREYIEDIRGLGYYTGNVHWKIITYILDDDLYLAPGYVCLGLSPIAEPEQVNGMSNDLISRKVLLGTERLLMTDIVENNPTAKYILEQVLFDIENAPTAFGKEKVIDQLKVLSSGIILNTNISDDYAEGYVNAAKDIIEIIEKGGIE